MPKQKTKKSIFKRVKITSRGKILRRHQLGAGHLKRKKTKGALERQSKLSQFFKGESRKFRKVLGIWWAERRGILDRLKDQAEQIILLNHMPESTAKVLGGKF